MSDLDDLIKEFLIESNENLERLDQDFLALEQDPTADERLSSIFRTIHTIKGTCGFLGLSKLESVSHIGESLLSKLRDHELAVTTEIISALLSMVDAVRQILGNIGSTGAEGDGDYTAIIQRLTALKEGKAAAAPAPVVQTPAPAKAVLPPEAPRPPVAVEPAKAKETESAPAVETPSPVAAAKPADPAAAGGIRVDVGLLDKLMNLVGELVLTRNQILQFASASDNVTLANSTQRLNLITTELQEGVMKTRMQPIGTVWTKCPRIVRDLAQICGKKVRVEMEGRETELDKTIIEAIKDPLTHIIRNSVDHGIESVADRRKAGKPDEGRLFLRAFHEGGQVNIEIIDDGGGIPVERVKKKAVERGLISADHAARMSEREATNLIFLPGFSTAEKVTNVSGRGVGMDVVKTNIEKIGGQVDVQSKLGEGTTLRIKIPLTLAIIPALIVSSGGDRFAIPQVSLLELVRLGEDQLHAVEKIHGAPVYRLRGHLLPLVYLNKELGTAVPKLPSEAVNIVVLQADERQFGLVVDEISDTEEIVVKPLSKQLKGLTTFAGATIMGDGKVALILDVMGVAQKASIISGGKDRSLGESTAATRSDQPAQETLLLFCLAGNRRMALPLSMVARLEEFDRGAVERAGGRDVIQYRGRIMPLIGLSELLTGATAQDSSQTMHVVVYTTASCSYGLVVDQILDIVDQAVVIDGCKGGRCVLGNAVIQDKVTELLDLNGVIDLFEADGAAAVIKAAA